MLERLVLVDLVVAAVPPPAAITPRPHALEHERDAVQTHEEEVGGVEGAGNGAEDVDFIGLVSRGGVIRHREGPVIPDGDHELLEAGEEVGERDGEVFVGYGAGGVGLEGVRAGQDVENDLACRQRGGNSAS